MCRADLLDVILNSEQEKREKKKEHWNRGFSR